MKDSKWEKDNNKDRVTEKRKKGEEQRDRERNKDKSCPEELRSMFQNVSILRKFYQNWSQLDIIWVVHFVTLNDF